MSARLIRVDGRPALRFERDFAASPVRVWRAVSEPDRLDHWFPAAVEIDGDVLRFTFPDSAPEVVTSGAVLEFTPPEVFAFRWNTDVLRFEVAAHGSGTRLVFTNTFEHERTAARTAAGWDSCLRALTARLDGSTVPPVTGWREPVERYVREFGLDRGHATGNEVRFVRDLMWQPVDAAWRVFHDEVGVATPQVPLGTVVARTAHVLVDEGPTGRVRREVRHDPDHGTWVALTHTVAEPGFVPTALASWHVQLDRLFAAAAGGPVPPWPADRFAALLADYTRRESSRAR
ncbi:SRPBCC family protein [Saccharothrix violaceirubra]|uniref:Uncharacterized protein YndB with AHSA1/START domain n=1 Tax=Saccharothrix violaceirubra TaxID=413306 RepID=A0A7W7WVA6_9PSEU|nr:SRPBCC domain-containing protein [Saccharothrix violaceirubra]MBB4964338.1 uncharacterized protein YndB with AHSA1/START domain [Saccharothrix violaceirubra]